MGDRLVGVLGLRFRLVMVEEGYFSVKADGDRRIGFENDEMV